MLESFPTYEEAGTEGNQTTPKNNRRTSFAHGPARLARSPGPGLPWLHSVVSSRPCQSGAEVESDRIGAVFDQRWAGKYPYYPNLSPILPWQKTGLEAFFER